MPRDPRVHLWRRGTGHQLPRENLALRAPLKSGTTNGALCDSPRQTVWLFRSRFRAGKEERATVVQQNRNDCEQARPCNNGRE